MNRRTLSALTLAAFAPLTPAARAWDAAGHRAITWLALDGLSPSTPAWLRDDAARVHMIGWEAGEPDRWRNTRNLFIRHENNPDHYMDAEKLADFGLTLETVPPLRYQFVAAMAVARSQHPERVEPVNPKTDPAGEQEWPGFVLHAVMEHHNKLVSGFKTLRTLEMLNDPTRAPQVEMAKANIMVEMGLLSHFVGDMAQPLHTTKHHHGWIGDNPNAYTTDRGIHAYIDGGVIALHSITYHTLRGGQTYSTQFAADADLWNATLTYFKRAHTEVEQVYILRKADAFTKPEGKAFIESRLHDAADMLAALYNHAWATSEPSPKDAEDLKRYDAFDPAHIPAARPADATQAPKDPSTQAPK